MRKTSQQEIASLAYPETRKVTRFDFDSIGDKVKLLREMIRLYSIGPHGPVMREYAVEILRKAGVPARDYRGQVEALLAYVQSLDYINEGAETFTTPFYTIQKGYFDCDDGVTLLGALLESIRIPVKMEILKWDGQARHIYLRAGLPPTAPKEWLACETTMTVPLGWEPSEYMREQQAKKRSAAL